MKNPETLSDETRFDVRELPCSCKHQLILERWQALAPGAFFVLVNGHDPLPLYYKFSALFPGEFDWVYEERGPQGVAIRITRLPEGAERQPSFIPQQEGPVLCKHHL